MHSPQRTGSYAWMFCLLTVALLDPSAVTAQSPDDPVADAGGPYVTYEEDVEDGLWPFTFDGSGSMPGDAGDPIVNYRWDAECVSLETFDGTVIDTDAWYTSRATQDDAITITGTSSWGSGYVFSKESVFRSDDLSVEGQVTNSGGYAMWGLKHNNTNFSYTAMPYAIYFHTYGYIYIYEDGSNRGHLGYFSFGVTYDVRINVKPTSGIATTFGKPVRRTGRCCTTQATAARASFSLASPFIAARTSWTTSVPSQRLFPMGRC